jgi:hypothetical protein
MHRQASPAGQRGPGTAQQEYPGKVGHADQLGAISRAAAAQHRDQMPVHGVLADPVPYRDLPVRQALSHLAQDVHFARSQVLGRAPARGEREPHPGGPRPVVEEPVVIVYLIHGHHDPVFSKTHNGRNGTGGTRHDQYQ